MGVGNAIVSSLLRSPLHRVLSSSTNLVRYIGRRSGRTFTTPTQYVRRGDDLIIAIARPETKTWWRNFRSDRDVEVLVQGRWLPMTGRAIVGADEPESVAPLLDAYLERFPRAQGAEAGGGGGSAARRAVIVWCRPR
ncbi:MAG TPA: nitroreductase/quinone reductase family protein [Acidimicrobiales bacterium]